MTTINSNFILLFTKEECVNSEILFKLLPQVDNLKNKRQLIVAKIGLRCAQYVTWFQTAIVVIPTCDLKEYPLINLASKYCRFSVVDLSTRQPPF